MPNGQQPKGDERGQKAYLIKPGSEMPPVVESEAASAVMFARCLEEMMRLQMLVEAGPEGEAQGRRPKQGCSGGDAGGWAVDGRTIRRTV